MIKEMINNMLGEYSKFIQIQDDGTVKVFVPEDVNNPSMENATELTLSKNEAIGLMGLVTQPKQYEVCDSSNNCRIIFEKDPDFDVNKWIKLALGTINYYSQVAVSCDTIEEYAKSGLVEPIENVTVESNDEKKIKQIRTIIAQLKNTYNQRKNNIEKKYQEGKIQTCVKVEHDTVYFNMMKLLNKLEAIINE